MFWALGLTGAASVVPCGGCRLSSSLSAGLFSLQVFTGVGGSAPCPPPPAHAAVCAGRGACRSPAVCPEACEVPPWPDRCVSDAWKVGGRVPEGVPV